MLRRPPLFLTFLALLALGWAQVFGMMRGYVCDCGGEVEITAMDHCHGPHGAACHDHEAVTPCHDQDDHSDEEDSHEHAPLTESVQAQQQSLQTSLMVAPMLAVIATLEAITPFISLNEIAISYTPPPRDDGGGRRWPQVLTRTIALQV
ncbi:MAG: hypothetical protein ABL974_07155 [Prosthecobacter sp.]